MASQIKTHFDGKIIMTFIIIFIISCGLLAFKINSKDSCSIKEFEVNAPSFKEDELITFSDKTSDSYEWKWYFGDGTDPSYRSKVAHSFAKEGKYTVKLIVNNNCTVEKVITIIPKKEVLDKALFPKLSAPRVVYQGEPVKFSDGTANAKSWEWRFGDSGKIDAIDKDPSYTFMLPGKKVISLVVNGNTKYAASQSITVLPAKKEKKDWVKERLERKGEGRGDAIGDYFNSIPDAPTRGPELKDLNEAKLKSLLLGVSENRLSYDNMLRYFCGDNLPLVQVRKKESISLKALDDAIRSRSIRIKSVAIHKDKDGCASLIVLDYKYKTLFN